MEQQISQLSSVPSSGDRNALFHSAAAIFINDDGSNITLKTLFEIVEEGLGAKVKISIEV